MEPSRIEAAQSLRCLRIVPLVVAAVLAFPAPARALGNHIGFEAAPWAQGLDGRASIDGNSTIGTTFEFKDTLGLEKGATTPMGRLWLRGNKNSFILDIADSSRSGSEVLSRNLTFNDTTYTASENLSSNLDVRLVQGRWRHSFVDAKVVEFDFDLGGNVAHVDMHLDGSASGSTSFNQNVPFPTVGAALIIKPFPGFHIRAEANGLSVTVSTNKVRIMDARLQIEHYFAHSLGIFAGYRSFRFNVESTDFGSVESTFKGAYAGLGFKF